MVCSRRAQFTTIIAIGFALMVFGLLIFVFMSSIIEAIVKDKLILAKGSYAYDMWKEVPIAIYLSFYLFNVTNSEKVLSLEEVPNLEEVGPYTFLEKRYKENITFHNNGTVSYQQKRIWQFVKEKSIKSSLSDPIIHLNIPLISGIYFSKTNYDKDGFIPFVIDTGCESNATGVDCSLFLKHNISQLLFDGYEDPFVELAKMKKAPFNKFGFFYGRNDSALDGVYSIYTGKSDINRLGLMDNWNYEKNLSTYWSGKCSRLDYSSSGDLRAPYLLTKTNQPIYMFVGDICRSLKFVYLKDVDVNGIKCKRYVADQSLFDYSLKENKCYCYSNNGSAECPANGVANISSCSYGAPIFISFPHFLYSDKSYSKFISGLKPSEDKHKFFMDIEPTLGIPMNVSAKIQINALLVKAENMIYTKNLTQNQLLVPQIWTSISAEIDSEMTDNLKLILQTIPLIDDILSYVLMGLGVLALISVLFFRYYTKNKKSFI